MGVPGNPFRFMQVNGSIPKRSLCSRGFWCMFLGLSPFGCVSIYYSYLYFCSVSAGF